LLSGRIYKFRQEVWIKGSKEPDPELRKPTTNLVNTFSGDENGRPKDAIEEQSGGKVDANTFVRVMNRKMLLNT